MDTAIEKLIDLIVNCGCDRSIPVAHHFFRAFKVFRFNRDRATPQTAERIGLGFQG
ncbi:MAG: hypothetical protein F6J87_26910 [Spirulina sp. SIO3F2]|nr:hypothetical protein [Spirulina sp. SIO3F2]